MTHFSRPSPTRAAATATLEPLSQLARFSWDWAPLLCDPAHGCCDYHRSWSSVRLLQKDAALPAGLGFFTHELSSLVQQGRRRVLISGAADTGLMALVCTAFNALQATPELVLVDRCRTTVTQNRVLAAYLGLDADIRQGDVRELNCEPVDAVIAHSFLGFFPVAQRQQVINAWGRVLSPGGKVLMSAMLAEDESVPFPPKDTRRLLASKPGLVARARAAGMTEAEATQLGEVAMAMLQKRLSQDPQLTRDFLDRAFVHAGIDLRAVTLREKERLGPLAAFRLQSEQIQRGEVVGVRVSQAGQTAVESPGQSQSSA